MYERFTDEAKYAVVLAQEEARRLSHGHIGTEHILLGLTRESDGVAARALESLGISLDAVRQQVEQTVGQGQQAPSGYIPFTPRAKKVLELSLREALQLSHNYIGTEHILLGLTRESDGVAAQVLGKLGADLNTVRQAVNRLLNGYAEPTSAEASATAKKAANQPEARLRKPLADVLRLASWEAHTLGHCYIGTEHLLLGLLLVEGPAPHIRDLLNDSMTVDVVREHIVSLVGKGPAGLLEAELTWEAADALDLAVCAAVCAGDAEAEPHHLAIALAGADNSVALRVMSDLGMTDRSAALVRNVEGSTAHGRGHDMLVALARRSAGHAEATASGGCG